MGRRDEEKGGKPSIRNEKKRMGKDEKRKDGMEGDRTRLYGKGKHLYSEINTAGCYRRSR